MIGVWMYGWKVMKFRREHNWFNIVIVLLKWSVLLARNSSRNIAQRLSQLGFVIVDIGVHGPVLEIAD